MTRLRFIISLALAAALQANASARPLSRAESMAARSGEIIGAASVCHVSGERLLAVGKQIIEQLTFKTQSEAERSLLQNVHEAAIYALASKVSRHPEMCPKALEAFSALERACISERLLDCAVQVSALKLPPR